MSGQVFDAIHRFFAEPPVDCGRIANERALQLELAAYFRSLRWKVEFEVPCRAERLAGSTLKPKYNLDLLVDAMGERTGIEIKVPLNGQHPETMYAVCADIEFVESLKRAGYIEKGCCLVATPDRVFWTDSGRGSPIHNAFRSLGGSLTGNVTKPTGTRDSCVQLEGSYSISSAWRRVGSESLMTGGRYALLSV